MQHRHPRSSTARYFPIAYKLALAITLLIAVGMGLLGLFIVDNQSRLLYRQMEDFGSTITKQVADAAQEPLLANDVLGLKVIVSRTVSHESIRGAVIYSDEMAPVVRAGITPPVTCQPARSAEEAPVSCNYNDEAAVSRFLIPFVTPVSFQDVIAGYALLHFDRSLLTRARKDAIKAITAATLLMVLIGIVVSVVLAKRVTKPIHKLIDASRAISAGRYDFRFRERRNDELGSLMESINSMTEGLLRKEQVEQTFSRYVSPKVAREVLNNLEQVKLGGQHVDATVLFADIVGFTSLSENMPPEEVSSLLNEYFTHIDRAAHACQGYVDKYMGDCVMLVFGIPEAEPEHAYHAISCAVLIRKVVAELNRRRRERGQVSVQFRIGINSGMMLAGNMGSSERMEYTVVGDSVNLASRLASVAGPDQVIVSETMCEQAGLRGRIIAKFHDTIRLRGKKEPVGTYRVLDVEKKYRRQLNAKLAEVLRDQEMEEA